MMLTWPFWLVLAIPLAAAMWLWPPTRGLAALRALSCLLVLLAMAGLCVLLPSEQGVVIVVADRSLSMPPAAAAQQKEMLDLLASHMRPDDRLAVVSFAQQPVVEMPPQHLLGKGFAGFGADVNPEGSNLQTAIDSALSLVDRDRPARLLVLSDGRYTGLDPCDAAGRASAQGVAIDYRYMGRPAAGDLAVARFEGPSSVAVGEAFMLAGWITSPIDQDVTYELLRGQAVIARGTQPLRAGNTRLVFRDKLSDTQTAQYTLKVTSPAPDPVPENNTARLLVGVNGPKPIILVSGNDGSTAISRPSASRLGELLKNSGLDVRKVDPSQQNWTLEELSGCSAVVLENLPAEQIGHEGLDTLGAWVTHGGGGLMMTGGQQSYGPGGYFKSPIEAVLPVSMELRQEHRKFSLAVVVVMDRSGSMAMAGGRGKTKIDLADLGAVEVLNMLSAPDQFGCIAVDTVPHEIVPLSDVTNKGGSRDKILRVDAEGGGIYIHEGLIAGAKMISPSQAGAKHIILFSDASDAEQSADYVDLVEKCRKAGITISVIGLGTEKDCDADMLKDLAKRGGGQAMFTNDAAELPRLFAQDTFMVARSTFLEQPTKLRATADLASLTPQNFGPLPDIKGYNLCYIRPGASQAVVTMDEYNAPVVASWRVGCGRALACTAEADGKFTGPLGKWGSAGDFFSSMARWTAGLDQSLGDGMMLTQELLNGQCRVRLYLDPQRGNSLTKLPELSVLCKEPGQPIANSTVQMSWVSADMFETTIPLTGGQTMMASLDLGPSGHATLPPACMPYSSEYAPAASGSGSATLEALARITGGCQRADLATIWGDLPSKPRWTPMRPCLLVLAVLLILAEVLQRRTGMLAPASLWLRFAGAASGARAIGAAILRRMPGLAGQRASAARSDAPMQGLTPGDSDDPAHAKAASLPKTSAVKAKPAVAGSTAVEPQASGSKTSSPPRRDKDQPGGEEFLDALSKARKNARDRMSR